MHKPDSSVIPVPYFNEPLLDDPLPLAQVVRQDPQPNGRVPIQEPSTRRAQDDLLDTHLSSGDAQAARLAREHR